MNRKIGILGVVVAFLAMLVGFPYIISGAHFDLGKHSITPHGEEGAAEYSRNSEEILDHGDGRDEPVGVALANSITFVERRRDVLTEYFEDYDHLTVLARDGDPWAGFVLSSWLHYCRTAAPTRTEEDFHASIERFRQTHLYESYRNGVAITSRVDSVVGTDSVIEFYVESMKNKHDRCNRLTSAQRSESDSWLDHAIELDRHPTFLLQMAMRVDRRDANQLLNEVWSSGDARALIQLYRINKEGLESGESTMDRATVYAYFIAWSEIERARKLRSSTDPSETNVVFDRQIDGVEKLLYYYELVEARKQAVNLIRKNPNCCVIEEQ